MKKLTFQEKLASDERRRQRQKEYESRKLAADPDGFRRDKAAASRRYYARNKAKANATTMRWRSTNRERCNELRREWRKSNLLRLLFLDAKSRAKKRGIEFTIEFSDLPPIGERCPLLGHPFPPPSNARSSFSPSIDRIDSNLGYVKGNVWIVGYRANLIKNDGTAEEHEMIAKAMRAAGVK